MHFSKQVLRVGCGFPRSTMYTPSDELDCVTVSPRIGFGHVKDGNREKLAPQQKALLDVFSGGGGEVVKFVERAA